MQPTQGCPLWYERSEVPTDAPAWEALLHPDDLPATRAARLALVAGESSVYDVSHRLRTKSGGWWWVRDVGCVVERGGEGEPVRVAGLSFDISRQKETEAELQRANQALREERSIFIAGQVVVFKWRNAPEWPVEYVSPNTEAVLGYAVDDWLSGRVQYAAIVHPDDLERVASELAAATEGAAESFTHQDYRVRRRDGRVIWLYDHTYLVRDPAGRVTHYLGYVLDVTARREAEAERRKIEARIQQTQKLESLGVLAGGIAHDFNNLLVGVLGNADLALLNLPPEVPARESVERIVTAAQRAAELVNQMLAYAGRGRFVVEQLSLSTLVEEMFHLLEVSTSKRAVIRRDLARETPPVRGDPTQIRQVLLNLITNASDAIGDTSGVITIRTGAMHCDAAYLADPDLIDIPRAAPFAEGVYSYVEVTDTGVGMDAETQRKIFEPFFSTKFTGRGLGLAAVLGIVRAHRGALKLYSEPGRGTTFKALFPAVSGPLPAPPGDELGTVDAEGAVALLVDDEETVRVVGREMLQRLGLEVVAAEDGRAALDIFCASPDRFRLVLLDLTMPRMDSADCLRELRRVRKDVPVILCSGYSEHELAERFAGRGVSGFLQKPYLLETLRAAIQRALGATGSRD